MILCHRSVFVSEELVYPSTNFSMFCKNNCFQLQLTKLEQFSVIALLKRKTEHLTFLRRGSLVFSVPWELFLTKKNQEQKNTPQIIIKERTAHLASYTFLTRDVDQYKNMSLSQLNQLTRTPFSQNTYHELLLPCKYCKVFKNSIFIEHLQKPLSQLHFFYNRC